MGAQRYFRFPMKSEEDPVEAYIQLQYFSFTHPPLRVGMAFTPRSTVLNQAKVFEKVVLDPKVKLLETDLGFVFPVP